MNKMNYGCEGLCVAISGGTSGIGLAAAQRVLAVPDMQDSIMAGAL